MTQPHASEARRYRSTLRTHQAANTRHAVTTAAQRLFEQRGFGATTIAAIANEAGVSQQTVYAAFGNKGALLRAIVQQMEESAEAAKWRERIAETSDPKQLLGAFAHWSRAFFEASSPSFSIAHEAAAELAELAAQGDRHRRAALQSIIGRLDAQQALRADLSTQQAVDRAWLLTGVQTYLMATQGCGWAPAEYADWLAETLTTQLLRSM